MLPNSSVSIHTRPKRRSKAEREVIQDGFAPKPPVYPGVVTLKATSLKVGSLPASCRPTTIRLVAHNLFRRAGFKDRGRARRLATDPMQRTMCESQGEALGPMQQGDFPGLGLHGRFNCILNDRNRRSVHVSAGVRAIEAGKHVLVEKPMAALSMTFNMAHPDPAVRREGLEKIR